MTSEELDELCRHAAEHYEAILYTPPKKLAKFSAEHKGGIAPYCFELIPDDGLIDAGVISFYPLDDEASS